MTDTYAAERKSVHRSSTFRFIVNLDTNKPQHSSTAPHRTAPYLLGPFLPSFLPSFVFICIFPPRLYQGEWQAVRCEVRQEGGSASRRRGGPQDGSPPFAGGERARERESEPVSQLAGGRGERRHRQETETETDSSSIRDYRTVSRYLYKSLEGGKEGGL